MGIKDPTQQDSELRDIVQATMSQDNFEDMYADAMELFQNKEQMIPEDSKEEILPLVEACLGWSGYDPRRADEVVSQHSDLGTSDAQLDSQYESVVRYRENVTLMLVELVKIFPNDLHVHLGMKQKDLQESISSLQDFDPENPSKTILNTVGREFLRRYRARK